MKKYRCPVCNNPFETEELIREHMASEHPTSEPIAEPEV